MDAVIDGVERLTIAAHIHLRVPEQYVLLAGEAHQQEHWNQAQELDYDVPVAVRLAPRFANEVGALPRQFDRVQADDPPVKRPPDVRQPERGGMQDTRAGTEHQKRVLWNHQ